MSKKLRVRRLFDSQHVKGSEPLHKLAAVSLSYFFLTLTRNKVEKIIFGSI